MSDLELDLDIELGQQLLQMLELPSVQAIEHGWGTFNGMPPVPAGWIAEDHVSPMRVASVASADALRLHADNDWSVEPLYSANQMAAACARISHLESILAEHGIRMVGDIPAPTS